MPLHLVEEDYKSLAHGPKFRFYRYSLAQILYFQIRLAHASPLPQLLPITDMSGIKNVVQFITRARVM